MCVVCLYVCLIYAPVCVILKSYTCCGVRVCPCACSLRTWHHAPANVQPWRCEAGEVEYWRGQRFVVLYHSMRGAIGETISQLFFLVCDRLAALM